MTITKDQAVGSAIVQCRTLRGVKAKELAEALHRSSAYVSRLENGERPAYPGDLLVIAELLNVDRAALENPAVPFGFEVSEEVPTVATVSGTSGASPISTLPFFTGNDDNVLELNAHGQVITVDFGSCDEPDGPDDDVIALRAA